MDWKTKWEAGLDYHAYLEKHGSESDKARWQTTHAQIQLDPSTQAMLKSWKRRMPVLVMSGAWCGDCAEQCPLFEKIESLNPLIAFRFVDRDADPELAQRLLLCGASRVPQAVVLGEDYCFIARSSDRPLSKYRQLAQATGEFCASGLVDGQSQGFADGVREWLELFERSQLTLRLSPRLRKIHSD